MSDINTNEESIELSVKAQDLIFELMNSNPQILSGLWANAILNVFVFGFTEKISFNEFKKNLIECLEDYKNYFNRIE